MGLLSDIREVIALEIMTLEDLYHSVDKSFIEAIELIRVSERKIIFSGMGKSGLIATGKVRVIC